MIDEGSCCVVVPCVDRFPSCGFKSWIVMFRQPLPGLDFDAGFRPDAIYSSSNLSRRSRRLLLNVTGCLGKRAVSPSLQCDHIWCPPDDMRVDACCVAAKRAELEVATAAWVAKRPAPRCRRGRGVSTHRERNGRFSQSLGGQGHTCVRHISAPPVKAASRLTAASPPPLGQNSAAKHLPHHNRTASGLYSITHPIQIPRGGS